MIPGSVPGGMTEANARLLLDALTAHDVDPTPVDRKVLDWLALWESETVRVIASWVVRASAAARGQNSGYRG